MVYFSVLFPFQPTTRHSQKLEQLKQLGTTGHRCRDKMITRKRIIVSSFRSHSLGYKQECSGLAASLCITTWKNPFGHENNTARRSERVCW